MLSSIECEIRVKADMTTLTVDDDGPADFQTIQEAINNAGSGYVIFVHNGEYYENLVVDKSVSLIGENRDSTIINGNKTGNVINITINNVGVMGFTIRESGMNLDNSGIHIEQCINSTISQNMMTGNINGISLYFSSGNEVSDNVILSNDNGVSLYSSDGNRVSDNTIQNNNYDGVSVYSSGGNVVSHNTILNNYDGVGLYFSSGNEISSNTILNNYYGMYLAFYSSNNNIHHNNFNNTNQVSGIATNIWNSSSEGNYWSDYRGEDLDLDGIGDQPYVIDENNKDNYPLMGMFSDFNVLLKTETYHVTVICNSTISDFKFEIGTETGNKIISFNAIGANGSVGLCRITIPTELLPYPHVVLANSNEVTPTLLMVSGEIVRLCFTYVNNSTIIIISREAYNELLDRYLQLQIDFLNLNLTYYDLLNNYSIILVNYTQLQENYNGLNSTLQKHLLDYSEQTQNVRNLMYIAATITAIFIMTAIYLSKRAHAITRPKTTVFEGK
jgi:nitrous oxidase accessory protein